ncbi:hypothetical protein OIV83_002363 [Microbotryomycetes sp. JL201]|nr:hypothetical protein OIV83_002363 [Microbotryomycetes sp. JL201]
MLYLTEPDAYPDVADQIMGVFLKRYGPDNLVKMLEVSLTNHRHPKLIPEHAGIIEQPVLLMHGTEDLVFPIDAVLEVKDALVNAAERFFLGHASLNSLPIEINFEDALSRLAKIDPSVSSRDASDPESFSLLAQEEIAYAQALIDKYSILEKDGRKYHLGDGPDAWTFSTRHEYTHRHAEDKLTERRPSLVDEIVVIDYEEGSKSRRASVMVERRF